ncbi:hypothetical protein ACFLYQ_04250 [Chloroflexota bacterium]
MFGLNLIVVTLSLSLFIIPTQVGIQESCLIVPTWIPVFTGMTAFET